MELLAIRHLLTQDNQEQRFSSGDRDISIIPNQQVPKAILDRFKGLKTSRLTIAHTGLKRSMQTAQILRQSLPCLKEPLVIPQFKERLGGQFAGFKFSALQKAFPSLVSPNQFWEVEAPDRGLESVSAFLSRIEEGINLLTLLIGVSDTIILVVHAGSLKGIKAVLTAKDANEYRQVLRESTPRRELFQFQLKRRQSS